MKKVIITRLALFSSGNKVAHGLGPWPAGVCPALERHGKACHALLSREDVHLIQTTMEADGMLICARWDIVRFSQCYSCLLQTFVNGALCVQKTTEASAAAMM